MVHIFVFCWSAVTQKPKIVRKMLTVGKLDNLMTGQITLENILCAPTVYFDLSKKAKFSYLLFVTLDVPIRETITNFLG